MEIGHPNSPEPTPEELNDLDKLRRVLEQAIADGLLTDGEVKRYKSLAWKDGKISPQELKLYQDLVVAKITTGELRWDWS